MYSCPLCKCNVRVRPVPESIEKHQASKKCQLDAQALGAFANGFAPISGSHPVLKVRHVKPSYRFSRGNTNLDHWGKIVPGAIHRSQPWIHQGVILVWEATLGFQSKPTVVAARDWLISQMQADVIASGFDTLASAIVTAHRLGGMSGVRAYVAKVIRGELKEFEVVENDDELPATEPMQVAQFA